jgi:thiamine biosynthesis lipoprotein
MFQLDFWAMGCQMMALVDSEDSKVEHMMRQLPNWFESWEQTLSRFRPSSELCELNRRSGEWVRLSRDLYAAIEAALSAAEYSQGLVDPTMLTALEMAGYDRPFQALSSNGTEIKAEPGPPGGLWRAIDLDPIRRAVRAPAGIRFDLGGVAKGWAAERAVERLAKLGPALVDAGGDIAVRGPRADHGPWVVAVADPHDADADPVAFVRLESGFVATSGQDYRCWHTDRGWHHHILDPRTGAPADTNVMTATAMAPSYLQAEAAAKSTLILGEENGLAWLRDRDGLEGLLVLTDGRIRSTAGMDHFLWERP